MLWLLSVASVQSEAFEAGTFAIPDTEGPFLGFVINVSSQSQQVYITFLDESESALWGGHTCQTVPANGGLCSTATTTVPIRSGPVTYPETTSAARWFYVESTGSLTDLWIFNGNEVRVLEILN